MNLNKAIIKAELTETAAERVTGVIQVEGRGDLIILAIGKLIEDVARSQGRPALEVALGSLRHAASTSEAEEEAGL